MKNVLANAMRLGKQALAICLAGAAMLPAAQSGAATFTEPATVLYGKIIGTGGAQPFQVIEGKLQWHIQRAGGEELVLEANLFPLQDGLYSYRLDVPHEALAAGLGASPFSIPLASTEQTHPYGGIYVNGVPARLAPGSAEALETTQVRRAATLRLDLEVPLEPADSDGDGIPDWWEAEYGLDALAGTDADGDGLSDLAEYLQGSDPTRGNGQPELASTELFAYAGGTSGILPRIVDSDSAPEDLVYTLASEPSEGRLLLSGSALAAGAAFTQADVLEGRLLYAHDGGPAESVEFEVSIRDENPAHAAVSGTIRIDLYRPSADWESAGSAEELLAKALGGEPLGGSDALDELRLRNFILGKEGGWVIWDGSSEGAGLELGGEAAAPARQRIVIGGSGQDSLAGGAGNDILMGRGEADVLRGNEGADRFEFELGASGRDLVADFSIEDGDIIDISRVLEGSGGLLGSYVQLGDAEGKTTLNIDADGSGGEYSDLVITLAGLAAGSADLRALIDGGHLATGGIYPLPRIIVAAAGGASENGPEDGGFEFSRSGSSETALEIPFSIGGSAENGTDYSRIEGKIAFAPGSRTAAVVIAPFADAQPEPAETVELVLLPGEGYELGAASRASVFIEDLQVLVSIEALEPVAVKETLATGAFLLRRGGIIDRSAVVRMEISGSAESGADYEALPSFVSFAAGQTTALLEVQPKSGALLDPDGETVRIEILPDPAYKLGAAAAAAVTLVERDGTFAAWRARAFPGSAGTLEAFANADPGDRGIPAILRYAFGLDPLDPDRGQLPAARIENGRLVTEFWRREDAADIEYIVSVSPDLVHWDSSPASVEVVTGTAEDGGHIVRYRATSPVEDTPKLFMNVRVILKP